MIRELAAGVLVALALTACAGPPRSIPASASLAPTPWCFGLVVLVGELELEVDGRGCSSERWACVQARDVAVRFWRAAGIVAVGECGYE